MRVPPGFYMSKKGNLCFTNDHWHCVIYPYDGEPALGRYAILVQNQFTEKKKYVYTHTRPGAIEAVKKIVLCAVSIGI